MRTAASTHTCSVAGVSSHDTNGNVKASSDCGFFCTKIFLLIFHNSLTQTPCQSVFPASENRNIIFPSHENASVGAMQGSITFFCVMKYNKGGGWALPPTPWAKT
ncbi:hypothetical protein E2C01_062277 [Portunus trituberculatus]|uniref:Uncharacterized protein n=1 Tax=Portunus trituberculatus TaxID=210409 RepID=A0A5B7HEP7_PORTR|nr:hypothetical protein [Portunus trituberculatus]